MLYAVVLLCTWPVIVTSNTHAQDVQQWKEVNIAQGPVRGYRANDTDVFVFSSIPYATTPKGQNKFKAPLPPPSWNETFEAIDEKIVCPQFPFYVENQNMIEECLIANIFVPDTVDTKLSVLVIVHGGGYQFGYGNRLLSPKSLVNSKKIIAITFNYRLGIHGFLCLGTEDAPGNAGMKDIIALLRWVKNNIASFGGNPDDVSVTGCSSGGSSVDLLILSKLTKGLMHKVLPESSSSLGPFAVQLDPLDNAKRHALRLNFSNVDDIDALTKFYTSLPFDILTKYLLIDTKDSTLLFGPCVERSLGQEQFLEDAPINILRNKKFNILPTYFGFANFEGMLRINEFDNWKDLMNENFADFLPGDLIFKSEIEKNEIAKLAKEYYFGNRSVDNSTVVPYVEYFTDVMFSHSILKSVTLQVLAGNTALYLHEYSFVHDNTPPVLYTDVRGVDHCFQHFAVMDEDESFLPEEYITMKAFMRQLWINFITTGEPTPKGWNPSAPRWPPVTGPGASPHYSIGSTVRVAGVPVEGRHQFWSAVYDKRYRTPIPPGLFTYSYN